jgi:ribose transport system permease protein
MAAVGTLVLVGGSLDLSVASIAALAGVISAYLVDELRVAPAAAILVGRAVGTACGAMNGAIVTRLRINAIITTIATLGIFRGAAFVMTDGQIVTVHDELTLFLGAGRWLGVPVAVWLMAGIFVAAHMVAFHTAAGRALYAVGASPRASQLSGLRLGRIRFWILVASGLAAGLAGILLAGQSGTAVPGAAPGYELLVVTAVLLGGTSLHGGEGRVSGTLLGVLIIGVLNNGMTLLSVKTFYQMIANGLPAGGRYVRPVPSRHRGRLVVSPVAEGPPPKLAQVGRRVLMSGAAALAVRRSGSAAGGDCEAVAPAQEVDVPGACGDACEPQPKAW